MSIKIIMINGPLRSGKDTCARLLQKIDKNFTILRVIDPVKSAIHTLFDCDPDPDYFEATKGYRNEELFGRVPREEYISLTEHWLKQRYGEDILGKLLWKKIARYAADGNGLFCIPGVGQGPEVRVLRSHILPEQICLIHLKRANTSFNGDTRGYIQVDGVQPIELGNYGSLSKLQSQLREIYESFLQIAR